MEFHPCFLYRTKDTMKGETFVIMSCGSHWQTVVLHLKAKSYDTLKSSWATFCLLQILLHSDEVQETYTSWTAVLVTWTCRAWWCSIQKASFSSMSALFFILLLEDAGTCLLTVKVALSPIMHAFFIHVIIFVSLERCATATYLRAASIQGQRILDEIWYLQYCYTWH